MKAYYFGLVVTCCASWAQAQTWVHEGKPATVIELFTSQGCSSCPPAEKKLNGYEHSDQLWTEVIPLAYHVDYWDYLGWKDKFAQPAFSQKQRLYRQYGVLSSVYTPGFVVNGEEWKGYFYGRSLPNQGAENAPRLELTKQAHGFTLTYQGKGNFDAKLVLLAMNERIDVKAGENRGRKLEQDFVVLREARQRGQGQWQFNIAELPENTAAVAAWLTKPNQHKPVQSVAGYWEK
ncbi:DUF1223 domain-containing protein [Vibrio sp. SCSIO 43136]|uniref:DUF1223 domain-containing protein n=1 Tax=Vibrio sp. SCSIO 43136 TaxID=2819101 RepID=UPI002075BA72|nr:DUF1223 domain-containing protein [Vibrio sp. SCSIO 43136]USD67703.1 DUF1223 domain-containing protein [Vibrio sp. SCSIO 43136]